MKLRVLAVIFCLAGLFSANSQTKVGTIDSELIVGLMPEMKIVLKRLNQYANRLDSSYQVKLREYQSKVAALQKLENVSDNFKKIKVDEITELERELQRSQQNGNQLIQLKKQELMNPLYKKVGEVLKEIVKAEGYTQVLITTGTDFAYIDPKYDLTKKTLDKLGIKIPEQNPKDKK